MRECFLGMVSLTDAYKAKESFRRRRIPSRIVNTPRPLGSRGCGYSIAAAAPEELARRILREDGIPVLRS